MPGIAALVVSSALSVLAYVVGEDTWDKWTYEDRVASCVSQVKKITTNGTFIKEAEINCRKTLK